MQTKPVTADRRKNDFFESYLRDGGEMGELTRSYDWSETSIGTPETWPDSLLITVSIILNSKFPMFLFWGDEHICFYNDAYRPSLGNNGKHPYALGKKGEDIWPEIWRDIKPLIDHALSGKGGTWDEDNLLPIYRNGELENVYWTYSYSPIIGEAGKPAGVFVTCVETTAKVNLIKNLEQTERRFTNLIAEAPVAMCILSGSDYKVELANQRMFELWGKQKEEIINKPIFEGLSEARAQGLEQLLHNVYTTGERFTGYERPVSLPRNGKIETVYINFIYEALKEVDGTITGIVAVATDVTPQVIARQKIEDAEERARLAITSAELGVYEVNYDTNDVVADERFGRIFGFDHVVTRDQFMSAIHPDDLYVRNNAVEKALQSGSLHYEVRVIWKDGSTHWIRVKGTVLYNIAKEPARLLGIVQDITEQKEFAEALENKVQVRTKELAEANLQLHQSNVELNQFAYIASHDLQEPLRKVRTFIELMQNSLGEISPKTELYINKIKSSSERMQNLINDVLKFSMLSKEREKFEKVYLDNTIKNVLGDYELLIEQKSAKINTGTLPVIEAIPLQMSQLFTNLISNSLKFASKERNLELNITCAIVTKEEVKQHKELNEEKTHYKIECRDNGIGFEQENAHQIFTIFQRLHGKTDYEGTGIGLALCKRIVLNHQGIIYANSQPDEGATFTVILPEHHR